MESTLVIREEIDLGNEPETFYELLGEGWFDPEREGAVDFRRSRGKRSWLSVPIRRVGDFVFVLRARSEVTKAPLIVRLDVNGHTVGSELLSDEWSEHSFDVPSKALTVGLNTLTFVYSTTPRAIDPAFRGKNTAVAVDRLRFVPQGSGSLTPAREIAPMPN